MTLDLKHLKQSISQEKQLSAKKIDLRKFFLTLIILIGVIVLLLFFFIGIVAVSGSSMSPEIQNGDVAVYNRLNKEPTVGDIVIVNDSVKDRYYIKRVIATGGDVVNIRYDGTVTVNDKKLIEPYIHQLKTELQDIKFPKIVPLDCFFLLGDNRPVSKDSRNSQMGMVKKENIKGTVLFIHRFY